MKTWESLSRNEKRLILVLKAHFDIPNIVWITGDWKTGKTDFSLWLVEFLERISVFFKNRITRENVASNINTYGAFNYITNFTHLKSWLASTDYTKLFLFDEVNKHLPARRSLSKKNVELLDIFPEISKARARLIVIGQNKKNVDKILSDDTWVKGTFYKVNLRTAVLVSPLLKRPFKIPSLPASKIKFDPYERAPFTLEPDFNELTQDFTENERIVYQWCNDKVTWRIKGHPQSFNRFLKKEILRMFKEKFSHFTYSGGGYI